MEAATETHNDLLNLLNEKNIALTETKAEAAQSANAVDKIIEENLQLKAENERLQAEIKELRIKLWDATEEERKMNAGRLHNVLKRIIMGRVGVAKKDHCSTPDGEIQGMQKPGAISLTLRAHPLENGNDEQQTTIYECMKPDEQKRKTINEQNTQIRKLEKWIAQMKGSKKIQEEILALKAKRADAKKKDEREIVALKAKHAEAGVETDKELKERERELEMVEDGNEEGY
ncbi:hypothetical protein KCU77_g8956, partial [Aureobasidium melanogenum]